MSPKPSPSWTESYVGDRIGGTSAPGSRTGAAFGRSAPPPNTPSTSGSRAPGIRAEAGRCSASRSDAPRPRIGPRARGGDHEPPVRRDRTGRRPARGRSGPSPRSGDPSVPCASGLRLLAYRAVDRDATDDRSAPDAVLPRRRRWDRSYRPGNRRGERGVPSRRVGPGHADRRRRGRRSRARRGRRSEGRPGRGERVSRDVGGAARGGVDLGQGVAALRTEQRSFARELSAMEADRHSRGQG